MLYFTAFFLLLRICKIIAYLTTRKGEEAKDRCPKSTYKTGKVCTFYRRRCEAAICSQTRVLFDRFKVIKHSNLMVIHSALFFRRLVALCWLYVPISEDTVPWIIGK